MPGHGVGGRDEWGCQGSMSLLAPTAVLMPREQAAARVSATVEAQDMLGGG